MGTYPLPLRVGRVGPVATAPRSRRVVEKDQIYTHTMSSPSTWGPSTAPGTEKPHVRRRHCRRLARIKPPGVGNLWDVGSNIVVAKIRSKPQPTASVRQRTRNYRFMTSNFKTNLIIFYCNYLSHSISFLKTSYWLSTNATSQHQFCNT